MPKILDACCGAKMFWFDRENPDVVYMDERRLETTLCDWREDLRKGFAECFRVLRPDGVLVFKWSEAQVPLKEILPLVGHKALFGERRSRKHWIVFMKGDDK